MADDDLKRGTFLGALGGIAAGLASFFRGFFAITAAQLLKLINFLREHIVTLVQDTLNGLHALGRALARAIRALDRLTGDGLVPGLLSVDSRIKTLKTWLTGTFAPVLAWLLKVKAEFDKIYKKWIRPILDTIDFIRLINRALIALHIHVLQGVDDVLARAQAYIDEWVAKIRGSITKLENVVDRIVTLDGFLQRLTLITSLGKYAPDWLKMFWNRQVVGLTPAQAASLAAREYPLDDPASYGTQLGGVIRGEHNEISGYVDELVPLWKEAAGFSGPGTG